MNTWYEVDCPKCGLANFINNGDPSDMSAVDSLACTCWNCKTTFSFADGEPEIVEDEEIWEGDPLPRFTGEEIKRFKLPLPASNVDKIKHCGGLVSLVRKKVFGG